MVETFMEYSINAQNDVYDKTKYSMFFTIAHFFNNEKFALDLLSDESLKCGIPVLLTFPSKIIKKHSQK